MKKIILFLTAAILTTGLISFEKNLEAQSWRPKNQSSKIQQPVPKNAAGRIQNEVKQGAQNINRPNAVGVTRAGNINITALPSCPDGEETYPSGAVVTVGVLTGEAADVTVPFETYNSRKPSPIYRGQYGSDGRGSIADFAPLSDSERSPFLVPLQEIYLRGSSNNRVHTMDIRFGFDNASSISFTDPALGLAPSAVCPDGLVRVRRIDNSLPIADISTWNATHESVVTAGSNDGSTHDCRYDALINTTSLFADDPVRPQGTTLVPIEFCVADATHVWKKRFVFKLVHDASRVPAEFSGGEWSVWRNDTFSRSTGSTGSYN